MRTVVDTATATLPPSSATSSSATGKSTSTGAAEMGVSKASTGVFAMLLMAVLFGAGA